MIDWFVILTPILLLPITLFFFFVGCTLLYSAVDDPVVTFDINFYLINDRLSHAFEFRIFDSLVELDTSTTNNIKVDMGGQGGIASQVSYEFSIRLDPGPATLSCRVIDTNDQQTLVDNGSVCQRDFQRGEEYVIVFSAGISEDGTLPNSEFDTCTPVLLQI